MKLVIDFLIRILMECLVVEYRSAVKISPRDLMTSQFFVIIQLIAVASLPTHDDFAVTYSAP